MTPKDWPGTAVVKVSCGSVAKPERPRSGIGGGHHSGERDPKRFDDGAVELRFFHRELMLDVVFFFRGEIGGGYLLHE